MGELVKKIVFFNEYLINLNQLSPSSKRVIFKTKNFSVVVSEEALLSPSLTVKMSGEKARCSHFSMLCLTLQTRAARGGESPARLLLLLLSRFSPVRLCATP